MAIPKFETVERNIRRIKREIAEIDAFVYTEDTEDRFLYLGMLERKREDIVRSTVLQMHTAIENILTTLLLQHVLDLTVEERHRAPRGKAARAMMKMVKEFSFDKKVELAFGLGVIRQATKTKLSLLGVLRNKCAHNWLLNVRLRHGRKPKDRKPPLLQYGGKNLHHVTVLQDFYGEYAGVYVRLYGRSIGAL